MKTKYTVKYRAIGIDYEGIDDAVRMGTIDAQEIGLTAFILYTLIFKDGLCKCISELWTVKIP